MLKRTTLVTVSILFIAVLVAFEEAPEPAPVFYEQALVNDVLFALGEEKPAWWPEAITDELIKKGEELVFQGRTLDPDGNRSAYISVYYMCYNCHNTVQEDPTPLASDAQTRLDYATEKNLKLLQGTTFKGITNRESWYNDDYYKKYGDLVKPAANDLRAAIQLCATECAQGREVEDWELDAIVSYYYSIGYTMEELGFTEKDMKRVNRVVAEGEPVIIERLVNEIKATYSKKSPATFLEPPYDVYWEQYNGKGDPDNGKKIYNMSCQACHNSYGVSDVVLGNDKQDFKAMARWFKKNNWWLHQVVRHGTHPAPGHRPYMPLYTEEKMNDQMIEDLKAYILVSAGKDY
jgi:cytochrome c5